MSTAAARCRRVPPTFSRWRDSPGWRPTGALARAARNAPTDASSASPTVAASAAVTHGGGSTRRSSPYGPFRPTIPLRSRRSSRTRGMDASPDSRVARSSTNSMEVRRVGVQAAGRARGLRQLGRRDGQLPRHARRPAGPGARRGPLHVRRPAVRERGCSPWGTRGSSRRRCAASGVATSRPSDRATGARGRRALPAGAAGYSAGPMRSEIVPTPSMDPSMRSPATTGPTPSGVPV